MEFVGGPFVAPDRVTAVVRLRQGVFRLTYPCEGKPPITDQGCPVCLLSSKEGLQARAGLGGCLCGRVRDLTPSSPDLPEVVELIDRVGKLDLPPVAREWPETRWDRFAFDETEAELFRGNALLHTDINPSNLIVGVWSVWAVDRAWPTRGAAFIDPALLVVQLVSAGHDPESAESWAAHCAAWRSADPKAIDAFAAATLRMYRVAADRRPDASWLGAMVAAAQAWVDHRGVAMA